MADFELKVCSLRTFEPACRRQETLAIHCGTATNACLDTFPPIPRYPPAVGQAIPINRNQREAAKTLDKPLFCSMLRIEAEGRPSTFRQAQGGASSGTEDRVRLLGPKCLCASHAQAGLLCLLREAPI